LPWDTEGVICNNENECFIPGVDGAAPVMVGDPAAGKGQPDDPAPDTLKNKPASESP